MLKRTYIPKVGSSVKLRLWEHYNQLVEPSLYTIDRELFAAVRAGELTEKQSKELREKALATHNEFAKTHDIPGQWAWFIVLTAGETECRLEHTSRNPNAPDPAWTGVVKTNWISPPIGWQESYAITCSTREQAEKVVNEWFGRGIHVWASHDLSWAGHMAFTPFGAAEASADQPASPHWQYTGEPADSIPAELCSSVFKVIWLSEWTPDLPAGARERSRAVKALRDEGVTVEYQKSEHCWYASKEAIIHQP